MDQRNVVRATVLRVLCISGTVLACCVTAARSEIPEDELQELVERIEPSIVRVVVRFRSNGEWSYGSGFCVNAWGDVVTNSHVVHDADSMYVQTRGGRYFSVRRILAEDEREDLALLSVDFQGEVIESLGLASELPIPGDNVILVGSEPWGSAEVLTGVVYGVCSVPGLGEFVFIKAPIRGGWSGSAVVNADARVIGVVAVLLPNGETFCLAATAQRVSRFLTRKGLDFFDCTEDEIDPATCSTDELSGAAAVCINRGDHRGATYYFRLAFEKGFVDRHAYVTAAWCHSRLDEHEDAVELLERALRLAPDEPDVYQRLARSHSEMGHEEEMISCYEQAVRLQPNDWFSRFWLGHVYDRRNEYHRALALYLEGRHFYPEDVTMRVGMASAYSGLGQYAEAAQVLREAIQMDPDYSLSHQNMAGVLVALGNYPDAANEYEQARRLDPTNGFIVSALGRCYLALGDLWRAAGDYWVLKSSENLLAQILANEIIDSPGEPEEGEATDD